MPLITQVPRPTPLPWLASLLVGLPLVVLGLTLLTGDPRVVLVLVFMSIVCTAGLGALFWLGLAIVIGLVVLYVADQLARLAGRPGGLGLFPGPRDPSGPPPQLQEQRQRTLDQYVARRLARQTDLERLRQDLVEVGWPPPAIEAALANAHRTPG